MFILESAPFKKNSNEMIMNALGTKSFVKVSMVSLSMDLNIVHKDIVFHGRSSSFFHNRHSFSFWVPLSQSIQSNYINIFFLYRRKKSKTERNYTLRKLFSLASLREEA